MTTADSPLGRLREQADRIAKTLQQIERGDVVDGARDPGGRIATSRARPTVIFGIAMDDKIVKIELSWSRIRETEHRFLSDFIVQQMQRQAGKA